MNKLAKMKLFKSAICSRFASRCYYGSKYWYIWIGNGTYTLTIFLIKNEIPTCLRCDGRTDWLRSILNFSRDWRWEFSLQVDFNSYELFFYYICDHSVDLDLDSNFMVNDARLHFTNSEETKMEKSEADAILVPLHQFQKQSFMIYRRSTQR